MFFYNDAHILLNSQGSASRSSSCISDTPRGSWASFDLRQTASDPLVLGLLDRLASDAIDNANKINRTDLQLV